MNPNEFYGPSDIPSHSQKKGIWKAIEAATKPSGALVVAIRDRRSFVYGMAASLLLFLSSIGVYTLIDSALRSGQPPELQFDRAYRSAIEEFESVLPAAAAAESAESPALVKRQQLALIDRAIRELREDIARTDLSPLKRSRLRQLYSMKLSVLQEIIEQGDVEL